MKRSSRITIITVCLNSGHYIEKTIQSIREQDLKPCEFIVIDGGSRDDTINILKKSSDIVSLWTSEPDRGISHAMNKGILLSRGEYLLFLQADDYLPGKNTISDIDGLLTGSDGYIFDYYFETKKKRERRSFHKSDFWFNFKGLCHQSTVCRRELFLRFGRFDESFHICMDYEHFMRLKRNGITFEHIPEKAISVMRDTGISSLTDWPSLKGRLAEERRVHFKYCPNLFFRVIYHIWWFLYPLYKRLRSF